MTTSLESLTLNELEERYNAMSRYLIEMKEEINRRKSISKDNSEKKDDSFIFNLLTSMTDTISSKKDEPDSTTRKIKATADDMKDALRKDNIKFKASILRDELESLIRTHNLVRVSEKISKERKIKK